jgi:hypothetical protein
MTKQKSGSQRQKEQEAEGALVHCSLCQGLFEPANWRQCVRARVVFCGKCRRERTKDVNRIKNAARGPVKKSAQMTGRTDRRIARLIAEAMGSVRTLYDRDAGIGRVPANLQHAYGLGLDAGGILKKRAIPGRAAARPIDQMSMSPSIPRSWATVIRT